MKCSTYMRELSQKRWHYHHLDNSNMQQRDDGQYQLTRLTAMYVTHMHHSQGFAVHWPSHPPRILHKRKFSHASYKSLIYYPFSITKENPLTVLNSLHWNKSLQHVPKQQEGSPSNSDTVFTVRFKTSSVLFYRICSLSRIHKEWPKWKPLRVHV